jgi:aspartyl-tRNA(Asn)/glutamyl-tRNA(Gln) amidotransferase subunit A
VTPEVSELSAQQLLDAYRADTLSPVEVVDALLARIAAHDAELGSFNTVCADRARQEAGAAERACRTGAPMGALAGVPFAVKDLFDSAEVRTTYGSPMFASHVPREDAAAVRRVREAGAIMLGKTQTHEFAWGITSVNELMGTSHNPWRLERMSGGSSGGSAVALAAGFVPLAIGSDTGGSIRVPSGFCGTVGLKPTYGRISTAGVWPLAPSLDHAGAMARTPADAALLLGAMDVPGRAPDAHAGLRGVTVGVCPNLHPVSLAPDVQAAFDAAVASVAELGAEVVELSLAGVETIHPAFGVIQRAEALHSHSSAGLWPGRRDEYGTDVRGRLESAERVTLPDYLAATATRERMRTATAALFERADVLLTPVAAGSPLPIGEERVMHGGSEIEFRDLVMPYTVPQDLLGLPTCTVRAGFDELGIPVGVQFTGRRWGESAAISAAQALFEATPALQRRRPPSPPGSPTQGAPPPAP